MTFAGAVVSLMLTAWIMIWMAPGLGLPILLAPLGATVAVLFGLLDTPGGQPRSVFCEPASAFSAPSLQLSCTTQFPAQGSRAVWCAWKQDTAIVLEYKVLKDELMST